MRRRALFFFYLDWLVPILSTCRRPRHTENLRVERVHLANQSNDPIHALATLALTFHVPSLGVSGKRCYLSHRQSINERRAKHANLQDSQPSAVYSHLKDSGFECNDDGCFWEEDCTAREQSLLVKEELAISNAEVRLARGNKDAEAEILRGKVALELFQDERGRILEFASKIRGGLFHLNVDGLKGLGPALEQAVEKDAAHAASVAYSDSSNYLERVGTSARAEFFSQAHGEWAHAKAKELLAAHGYKVLRRDFIFGPFMRSAETFALDLVSSKHNPRRIRKLLGRVGLLAASRLWSSPLPILSKKRMANAVVTEAIQLMIAEYSSQDFVDMADLSLTNHRRAKLKAAGEEVERKCYWPFVLTHAPIYGAKKHKVKTAALVAAITWQLRHLIKAR